jgi:hypothetical protein
MKHLFVLIAITFSGALGFAEEVKRNPTQAQGAVISVKIVYGEKTNVFQISKTNSGGKAEVTDSSGYRNSRPLTQGSYDDIYKRIESVGKKSVDIGDCYRIYMSIQYENGTLVNVCMRGKDAASKNARDLSTALGLLF